MKQTTLFILFISVTCSVNAQGQGGGLTTRRALARDSTTRLYMSTRDRVVSNQVKVGKGLTIIEYSLSIESDSLVPLRARWPVGQVDTTRLSNRFRSDTTGVISRPSGRYPAATSKWGKRENTGRLKP